MQYDFIFPLATSIICPLTEITQTLAEIAQALANDCGRIIPELAQISVSHKAQHIAATLKNAQRKIIWIGEHALNHPHATQIRAFIRLIGELSGAAIGALPEGANSAGAWLAGAIPHRGPAGASLSQIGSNAKTLLTETPKSIYLLWNFEPEFDCAYSAAALKTLSQAKCVVCFTPFVTKTMEEYADFILPITPFTENSGTFINAEGRWQNFIAASLPEGNAKPGWKVLQALANFLRLSGFDYGEHFEIHHELKEKVEKMPRFQPEAAVVPILKTKTEQAQHEPLMRLAPWPMVRVDNLVRRAEPLQKAFGENLAKIQINTQLAERLHLKNDDWVTGVQGESRVTLQIWINDHLADNMVYLPSGLEETAGFGQAESEIELIELIKVE